MLQSSQTGHTISGTQSTVAMNNITEEEGEIYLYIIIQNTVSYSVVADHFGQHPKII